MWARRRFQIITEKWTDENLVGREQQQYMAFGLIALVAFWAAAIKLWLLDGAKIPLIFIALWLVGFFAFPRLHWSGAIFLAFECILAVILLLIDRYKSALL